jgi:hypothetical protein
MRARRDHRKSQHNPMSFEVRITWKVGGNVELNWDLPSSGYNHAIVWRDTDGEFADAVDISGPLARGINSYTDTTATADGTGFYYWVMLYNGSDFPMTTAEAGNACQNSASGSGRIYDPIAGPLNPVVDIFPFINQPFFPGYPTSVYDSTLELTYVGNADDVEPDGGDEPPFYAYGALEYDTSLGHAGVIQVACDLDDLPAGLQPGATPQSWVVGSNVECSSSDGATSAAPGTGAFYVQLASNAGKAWQASSNQSASVSVSLAMGTPGGYSLLSPPPPPPIPPPGQRAQITPPVPTPLPCIPCCITQVPLITQTGKYLLNAATTP